MPLAERPSGAFCGTLRRSHGRLRGGQPGDRHTVGRARHVIEADFLAEADRSRIATMLAADAELDARSRRLALFSRDPHQFADAIDIERHERILLDDALLPVGFEEG